MTSAGDAPGARAPSWRASQGLGLTVSWAPRARVRSSRAADQAAQRIARQTEWQASSECAAKIEREAQALLGVGQQAEARDHTEIEM